MSELKKITITVTESQYKYLKGKFMNISDLVRHLLEGWIKEQE